MDTIKDILIKHNISPSFHRLKIYEYVMKNRVHPTVDMIYCDLLPEIPTLSKTTVYNTLKSFMHKGLVIPITIENNEVRYDADISFHGHFKCNECGKVYDIDLVEAGLLKKQINGHKIFEHHYNFKGICKNCINS